MLPLPANPRRRLRLLLPGLTLVALALAAVLAAAAPPSPAVGGGTGRPAALGVQVHPLWAGVSARAARGQIDAAADAGARLVRVDVGWASLQQDGRGRWSPWYLRRLDTVVAAAHRRGLRVLATVTSTPCWASRAPARLRQGCRGAWWERGVERYPPRRARDYARALRMLAHRYRGRVQAWEIWNEPNQQAFLRARHPAVAYAGLLRAAYPAIKGADPRALVVGGSLAEADHRFVASLYALGARGSFDALSVHPYSGDRSPLDRADGADATHSFVRGVPAVRRTMLAAGDRRPLWLTELGWSTTARRDGPTWERGVDAQRQARYLEQAVRRLRAWDYVDVAVWYTLRDTSADLSIHDDNFGLLTHDGRPKPVRAAFARLARG